MPKTITNTDYVLAVEGAMTDIEKASFLARWYQINPNRVGEHVADALDELENSDSNLDVIESLWEMFEQSSGPKPIPILWNYCVQAIIYATGEQVDGVCGLCGGSGHLPESALFPSHQNCPACTGIGHCLQWAGNYSLTMGLYNRVVEKLRPYA